LRKWPGFAEENSLPAPLGVLEPSLADPKRPATFLKERVVDPRTLGTAALKAAKHHGVDISSGSEVTGVLISQERVNGVRTEKTTYTAPAVVNCAGAWAGGVGPHRFPTRPVKGQMLSVAGGPRNTPRHVIRSPEVYLVPRSDGRVLIGATVEEAGFDKRTDPDTIEQMHRAGLRLIPALGGARILEAWAGLRPGTPDNLPILGVTATPGYFVATGHFRDGILLTPVTAHVMAQVIMGAKPEYDISAFSPMRFQV
jgi:glycine oxidase